MEVTGILGEASFFNVGGVVGYEKGEFTLTCQREVLQTEQIGRIAEEGWITSM
jgi:hypothetical protein